MFYVFEGQNATTGEPNPRTGLMSNYGHIVAFETKAERDEYVQNHRYYGTPGHIVQHGTPRTLRKFCRGMSMADYNEMIEMTIPE